jgi:hypothetical protein
MKENIESFIIVLLIFIVPGILGLILYELNIYNISMKIIACLMIIGPLFAIAYYTYKAFHILNEHEGIKAFTICLAVVIVPIMFAGLGAVFICIYIIPIILYTFVKVAEEKS